MTVVSSPVNNAGLQVNWRRLLLETIVISSFVLGLFYYWFGIADRYAIFLYGHEMFGIPAEPFDDVTSSRYWMSGLVAAGAVLILYIGANWFVGRLANWRNGHFVAAVWWQVWALCAIPISLGILAITMTANTPTLPFTLAMACVASTLTGLAIALLPGNWAAECPSDLVWLAADGIGLMPPLLLIHAVEFQRAGASTNSSTIWIVVIGSILVGIVWLAGLTGLRLWRRKQMPSGTAILLSGIGLSYLLMPLTHYLVFTPPAYRYISNASNFFAINLGIQILALGVAASLARGVTSGRQWLLTRLRTAERP